MKKTTVAFRRVVAVILTIYIIGIHAVDPEDEGQGEGPFDLNDLTQELMTPVFQQMKKMGETMRDEVVGTWENVPEGVEVKQFLLVAVLSRGELEQVSTSKEFPLDFSEKEENNNDVIQMRRMVFLLNIPLTVDTENRNIYGKTQHTEVTAIDFGYIDKLRDRFAAKYNNAEYPLILMYSHYIPCYGVRKIHYSCAQEIGHYARNRHNEFGFLVAFTELFHGTEVACSRKHIREGGVLLFEYQTKDGEYNRIEDFHEPSEQESKRTLQGDLYNAFIRAIPKKKNSCCIGDAENKKMIVAFFINEMTYTCTHSSTYKSSVNKFNKDHLSQCMDGFMDAMGNDCGNEHCKKQPIKGKLRQKVCITLIDAARDRIFLGKPPGTNDLGIYNPTWTAYDGAWKDLYLRAPSEQARALPAVKCANRMLSKVSLCTKQQDEPGSNTDSLIEEGALRLRPDVQLELQNPENQLAVEDVVQMRQGVQLEPGQHGTRTQDVDIHDTVQDENAPLLGRIDRPPWDQRFGQSIRRCFCCCRDDDYDD